MTRQYSRRVGYCECWREETLTKWHTCRDGCYFIWCTACGLEYGYSMHYECDDYNGVLGRCWYRGWYPPQMRPRRTVKHLIKHGRRK